MDLTFGHRNSEIGEGGFTFYAEKAAEITLLIECRIRLQNSENTSKNSVGKICSENSDRPPLSPSHIYTIEEVSEISTIPPNECHHGRKRSFNPRSPLPSLPDGLPQNRISPHDNNPLTEFGRMSISSCRKTSLDTEPTMHELMAVGSRKRSDSSPAVMPPPPPLPLPPPPPPPRRSSLEGPTSDKFGSTHLPVSPQRSLPILNKSQKRKDSFLEVTNLQPPPPPPRRSSLRRLLSGESGSPMPAPGSHRHSLPPPPLPQRDLVSLSSNVTEEVMIRGQKSNSLQHSLHVSDTNILYTPESVEETCPLAADVSDYSSPIDALCWSQSSTTRHHRYSSNKSTVDGSGSSMKRASGIGKSSHASAGRTADHDYHKLNHNGGNWQWAEPRKETLPTGSFQCCPESYMLPQTTQRLRGPIQPPMSRTLLVRQEGKNEANDPGATQNRYTIGNTGSASVMGDLANQDGRYQDVRIDTRPPAPLPCPVDPTLAEEPELHFNSDQWLSELPHKLK